MKILWLSHFIPYPPKGGQLQRSHNLLKQVAKYYEVDLIALNQKIILPNKEDIEEATDALNEICNSVITFPIPSEKTKWHRLIMTGISYFSSLPYDINWLHNGKMLRLIKNLINNNAYDLIHVDTIGMFPYSLLFYNRNIVLNHHNIESSMMARRFENEINTLKKEYFRKEAGKLCKYERYACNNCTKNFVVSDLDAIRLRNIVGDVDITVVQNGVDTEYFKPREPLGKKGGGLIFAGPMDWYPNREAILYFLSEIWPILRVDDPERQITIVGKNPPKELIFAARNSKISAPGFVDDIRPFIDSASIYICPIRNGGGTRLKILDALAMGKPLVATRLAVEGLDLVEEENYLPAETGSEFVTQIKRLEEDDELRMRLALTGRKLIEERYSWDIIGKTVNIAYKEAILK